MTLPSSARRRPLSALYDSLLVLTRGPPPPPGGQTAGLFTGGWFSARRNRVARRRECDDTTQIAVLPFAQVRSQPPCRGISRPGAAGTAEPQGVLTCAR